MARVLTLLFGCFVPYPEPAEITYDAQGLPDCEPSFAESQRCDAIASWSSSEVTGFTEGALNNQAVRWIGTEVQPAFCTDDAAEAEGWVLAQNPEGEGSHVLWDKDPRWWDVRRYNADRLLTGQDRVMRCSFATNQAATPPGLDDEPELLQLTEVLAATPEEFFPMAREMSHWRRSLFPVQAVLAFGEATSESSTLRVCAVRCGECTDLIGPTRNYTAILETQDWVYDPALATVSYAVSADTESDCQAKF